MDTTQLFEKLWQDYAATTPSAELVKKAFENEGNTVNNDHIAFRTFNDPRINIDQLAALPLALGYEFKNDYVFEEKKLYAKHLAHKTNPSLPLIFISELKIEEFPIEFRLQIQRIIDSIDFNKLDPMELLFAGRLWELPSYEIYSQLLEQSEYAAWLYVNGFCANHFTVAVNDLTTFSNLESVNAFLKEKGFVLNTSGGEIKGTPEQLLRQSSIVADNIPVQFQEGIFVVTSCYYEFAYRYHGFTGFIANSADKIFESTDKRMAY
ncbi:DUF1338 domain-containing protein [Aureisphaera galaxeae]|uniref:DUF1338 domain-containing protein n=1 Tax=Aureisphaera galaxeae TaxID=1538023 RepID=UPI002350FAC1|nr:DUF1338 domain-containing protein [Aureisphaera galaxeae]MDC8004189.1 DUF1338 domain-containing protein [Aureisphaera galaxeae]